MTQGLHTLLGETLKLYLHLYTRMLKILQFVHHSLASKLICGGNILANLIYIA